MPSDAASDVDDGDDPDEEPLGRAVQVNRADLVRGMICVGKKQAVTLLREPERRTSEVRGLASLLDAYVAFTGEGPQTSAFYDELDSREKASFSYRFGMGLALLAAQKELEIPWLMHLASLQASGTAQVEPEGASRTDLVGLSLDGRWFLVKARARSREITASILEDTQREVAEVAAVNDREPAQRRACVAGLGEAPFRVSFEPALPPEEEMDEPVHFAVDPSQYIAEYYAQFSFFTSLDNREHAFEEGSGCGNLPPAVLSDVEGTPYELGLLRPLNDALQPSEDRAGGSEDLDGAVPVKRGWEPQDPARARQAGVSVGRDGVVVKGPSPPSSSRHP